MTVKKAVIAAGGYGLNLLPATKALPKEILPVFDHPVIDFVVREAQAAGITDILMITTKSKRNTQDYFDSAPALEINLREKHKTTLLKYATASTDVDLYFTRQSKPTGIGDAILLAEDFVDHEPFVVMLSDDIVNDPKPLTKTLVRDFETSHSPVLGIQELSAAAMSSYGAVELADKTPQELGGIKQIVEKPEPGQAPSRFGVIGRYVLPASFFDILRHLPTGTTAGNQLTQALNILNEMDPILARQYHGQREDIGTKFGLLKASIDYGLKSKTYGSEVAEYIKNLTL